jgi:hypothetical protein
MEEANACFDLAALDILYGLTQDLRLLQEDSLRTNLTSQHKTRLPKPRSA